MRNFLPTQNAKTMNDENEAPPPVDNARPTRKREKSHLALLAEENRKAAEDEGVEFDESDEEEDQEADISSGSNKNDKPIVHRRQHWTAKNIPLEDDADQREAFHSVDGDKICSRWGRRWIDYRVARAMAKAEKSLLEEQDDQQSIVLEPKFALDQKKMTQVPYRK